MTTLIIDTKLMMYYKFHRNQSINTTTFDIAALYMDVVKTLPKPDKIIFAYDVGASFRRTIYPDYKMQRKANLKKQSKSHQDKVKAFEKKYLDMQCVLKHFGNVVALEGIEADDIASILSKSSLKDNDNNIVFLTADSDWVKFMVQNNIYMLHPQRKKLISFYDLSKEFGYTPRKKVIMDAICGVAKENIKGLFRFGPVAFDRYWEENDGDVRRLLGSLELLVEEKPSLLPEGYKSLEEMYKMNYELVRPLKFSELSEQHQEELLAAIKETPDRRVSAIVEDSAVCLGEIIQPTPLEATFFNLKYSE
jgi:5'-3' exonuclease